MQNKITHEKLQGYVVDEDVLQRDNAQLSKVGCQLQGVHLLHNTGNGSAKICFVDETEFLQMIKLGSDYASRCLQTKLGQTGIRMCFCRMQQCRHLKAALQFLTLPDCSLWILVSHTFFTNRRLLIWFLITLMSKGQRKKDNKGGEQSKS